ncbi:MAG: sigma-54 dependent transcriptional regulator [Gemmatimonadales bacterium]
MTATVLIVDDEHNLRRMLRSLLEVESYDVLEADGALTALEECQRSEPDVILTDLVLGTGADGIDLLEQLRARQIESVVVMMSGKATLDDAVRATKLGAFQFLEKPLTPETVLTTVSAALELTRARTENRALRSELTSTHEIVGSSAAMEEVRKLVAGVATTPARVLITGESGTGKELVAREIHRQSPRADLPMVSLNCAAVPRDLLESELFGHERGAFTGAVARRRGKFELADKSTLFLDEVGDMHLDAQAKLLRTLETSTIERLGGESEKAVDVRVIAATNMDLEAEAGKGIFRADLFYRLNVFPIRVPPLRDRLEDLPALVEHFAALSGAKCARAPRQFGADALKNMRAHRWPGNVRELANLIERLTIIGTSDPVSADEVDSVLPDVGMGVVDRPRDRHKLGLAAALETYEAELIRDALTNADGNVAEAARRLRTDRANLHRRMRRLGLSRSDTDVS